MWWRLDVHLETLWWLRRSPMVVVRFCRVRSIEEEKKMFNEEEEVFCFLIILLFNVL